jgi:uncharacterized protein (TIGR03437 family)
VIFRQQTAGDARRSVTIGGKPAAIAYIGSGHLNVQAPATVAAGPVSVQATNSSGTAIGTVTVQA